MEEGFVYEYQGKEYPPSMRGELLPWLGITYPSIFAHGFIYSLWKHIFCPRGWHLWDEVHSMEYGHSIYCDACELDVHISPTVGTET